MPPLVISRNNITIGGKKIETAKSVITGITQVIGPEPAIKSRARIYPPIQNITSANHLIEYQPYGNGYYVISFSSFGNGPDFDLSGNFTGFTSIGYEPWNVFKLKSFGGGNWGADRYIVPHGTFNSSLTDNIVPGYTGDWIKIRLPVAINLKRYVISSVSYRNNTDYAPRDFKIYGSNNGINWVELTHITNTVYVNDIYDTSIITSGTYNNFGLVVNKLMSGSSGNANTLHINEWLIYGDELLVPNNSLIAHYSFDNATNIGLNSSPLGAIFNAISNGPLTLTTVKYVNGNSSLLTTGSQNDISLLIDNNSNKLFTYVNYKSISISFWCWTISVGSDIGIIFYGSPSNKGDNEDIFMLYHQDNVNQLRLIISRGTTHEPLNISIDMPIVNTGWTHVTIVIELKTANINLAEHRIKSYVNGFLYQIHNNKFYPLITNNYDFQIGRWRNVSNRRGYTGYIDDFRIYNNALTDEEVMLLFISKETYVKPIVINNDYNYMSIHHNPYTLNNLERIYPPIRDISSVNHSITGQTYGNGNYVISFSSSHSTVQYAPWNCFSTNVNSGGWWSEDDRYILSTGEFISSLTDNIVPGYNGDWIKIRFPVAINLTKYAFSILQGWISNAPENFKIYGSNDEITWVELVHITNAVYFERGTRVQYTQVSTSGTYNSFGLVVNKLVGNNVIDFNLLHINQWLIYGMEVREQTQYTIIFPEDTPCDILVVGGGGAGGDGGGGGGQLMYQSGYLLTGEHTITVGKGGASNGKQRTGNNGEESSIANATDTLLLSYGGGGGAGAIDGQFPIYTTIVSSGGGSSYDTVGFLPQATYTNFLMGSVGSKSGQSGFGSPGGGGGAGENAPAPYNSGIPINSTRNIEIADGGDGIENEITGTLVYYGGGGAGGINTQGVNSTIIPQGGLGGGGNGTNVEAGRGTEGVLGTGGGGGGCEPHNAHGGRNGGSGIVIIKYKKSFIEEDNIFPLQWTYNSTNPSVYHLGNVGIGTINPTSALDVLGSVVVNGGITSTSLVANTKNFRIAHPLGLNKWLYHGCVEGPRFDNMYRGKKMVINGTCEVDIDNECNTTGGMTTGTFMALNNNCQVFLENKQTYDMVKGEVIDGKIIITCENIADEIEVEWLVIGERHDEGIIRNKLTNNEGMLICEHEY